MTDMRHVYLVAQGVVQDEVQETWQIGIRYLVLNSSTAPAQTGTLGTSVVDAENVHRTETDWTIESNWSTTPSTGILNPDDWLNDQVAPAFQAQFGPHVSNQQKIVTLKASPTTATGHVAEGRTCVLNFTNANPQGAATGDSLPLEVAAVVSWQTGLVGKRGRGRVYLPALTTAALTSSGRYSTAVTSGLVAAMKALLQATALTGVGAGGLWVLPIVCAAAGTQYGVINSLSVGNVPDSQRRRRRSLDEVRSSDSISY